MGSGLQGPAVMEVGQKSGQQADGRQIGAELVDEADAGRIGYPAERAAPSPAIPKASPKKRPEIIPTFPGSNSWA